MKQERSSRDIVLILFLLIAVGASIFFFYRSVSNPGNNDGEEISEKILEEDDTEANAEDPPQISSEDLRDLIENNERVTIINPESRENFFKKHIPGSISFPSDELAANLPELPRDHTIIVTSSGSETGCNLSIRIARALVQEGFPDVRDHHDGWAGWENEGFPTAVNNEINVPQISASDLERNIDDREEMTIIDLRDPAEFNAGSIPGSINVPFYEFSESEKIPHNQLIVLYDDDGNKSNIAGKNLLENNYVTVRSLVGGYNKWKLQGKDIK